MSASLIGPLLASGHRAAAPTSLLLDLDGHFRRVLTKDVLKTIIISPKIEHAIELQAPPVPLSAA